jgi:hypothetical protein
MSAENRTGRQILLEGYPWFSGKGRFPLPAYSEFMPPPRLGRRPCGETDPGLLPQDDPWGFCVSEIEEEYELQPGLRHLARQIAGSLAGLGRGEPEYRIAGHKGRNLIANPYWPPDLAAKAGALFHERFVTMLPLALSRTQDDKGRVRWTFFGGSEQGPERGFWQGFYSAPGKERASAECLGFFVALLARAYGEPIAQPDGLRGAGFRILPTDPDERFPFWRQDPLPSWSGPYLADDSSSFESVRYLLTFKPFGRLPRPVRQRYLEGRLCLLPFPGSLVFWGVPSAIRLQEQLPFAMQTPLLRVVPRHGAPGGFRVPQSGWLHEPGRRGHEAEVHETLLVNTYRRTSRWDRVHRHEDDVNLSTLEDRVARVLFSTASDVLGLYDKPMARNCQIWTEDSRLLLNGPDACPSEIMRAASEIENGGQFRYRFFFPPMQVGLREVYWHRPLVAFLPDGKEEVELLPEAPSGYLTAYRTDSPDPAHPISLWPRLLRREPYLLALRQFEHLNEYYAHQTALNIVNLLDAAALAGRPLARSFARDMLRASESESLEEWLESLPEKANDPEAGKKVREAVENVLEPPAASAFLSERQADDPPASLTYGRTATRSFEEAYWKDILTLAHGEYVNKDNADCVQDPITLARLSHRRRDLEALGDYLLSRHRQAIAAASMEGAAVCGEIPFHWKTDFDFPLFGGWKNNQEGHSYERDLLVVIPGRNRSEAVILADHYDTAYMEDLFDKARGGSGARVAAAGADDNHSATAALLQAAPILLGLSREGRLERDVWLLHLTGEEFPADCMGARFFCRALVEKTLCLRVSRDEELDLSRVRVVGVLVMDMIAHNRDSDKDDFQISPGKGAGSLALARQAHEASRLWNAGAERWNRGAGRRGKGRGKRTADGRTIPEIVLHPRLRGEIRTPEDPRSSLFNTDGQIFSDVGVPVILFMENYDINRKGYHDTRDTMANIDLDYGAAVAAIAIETAARLGTNEASRTGSRLPG